MNAIFLARLVDDNPFHLYLNKSISSPDLTGLKIASRRSTATSSRRSAPRSCRPRQAKSILARARRGRWLWLADHRHLRSRRHEKTKFRVDPGFYTAEVSVLVNKTDWDKLTAAQKAVLRKAAERGEAEAAAEFRPRTRKTRSGRPTPAFKPSSSMARQPRPTGRRPIKPAGMGSSSKAPNTARRSRAFSRRRNSGQPFRPGEPRHDATVQLV